VNYGADYNSSDDDNDSDIWCFFFVSMFVFTLFPVRLKNMFECNLSDLMILL
jgi:hypothetical protein